jgi:O-antigen/teichoic acid export membrane protein
VRRRDRDAAAGRGDWLSKGGLYSRVAVLASGAGAGQLILILASPLLTRIYPTTAFGSFATFVSLVGLVAAVATLRLETRVAVLESDHEASALLYAGLYVSVVMALGGLIASVWVLPSGDSSLGVFGPFVVFVSVLLISAQTNLTQWQIRIALFSRMAIQQVGKSAATAASQVSIGLVAKGPAGLVVGQVAGQAIGLALALRTLGNRVPRPVRIAVARQSIRAHKDLVFWAAPQSLLNALGSTIPIVVLTFLHGPATAGLFFLVHRVLMLPSQVVAESLRGPLTHQVVAARGARDASTYRRAIYLSFLLLVVVAVPVSLLILIAGPNLFAIIFGQAWREAGVYAQPLVLLWFVQLVSVPCAVLVPVLSLQRPFLIAEVASNVLRLVPLVALANVGVVESLVGYAIGGVAVSVGWMCFCWVRLRRDLAIVRCEP